MDDLATWLRAQIAEVRRLAELETGQPWPADLDPFLHWVLQAPVTALAQCEAHTAILDIIERYGHPTRIPATDFTTTLSGLAPYYALQRILAAVAHAYQHHPGYEEATVFLRQEAPPLVGQPIADWPQIGSECTDG